MTHVEIPRRGIGQVVERGAELGEVDHVDGAFKLTTGLEDVGHPQRAGRLEVAALELAVEVVDSFLAMEAGCLLPEVRAVRSQRGRDFQKLGGLGRTAQSAQPSCKLDEPGDHRRVRHHGFAHSDSESGL